MKITVDKWLEENDKIIEEHLNDDRGINLRAIKYKAKQRNLSFNLTEEDVVVPEFCPILNIPLKWGDHRDNRPEVDRMIPEKGYIKGNVTVISGRANRIKYNASINELQKIVDYMQKCLDN